MQAGAGVVQRAKETVSPPGSSLRSHACWPSQQHAPCMHVLGTSGAAGSRLLICMRSACLQVSATAAAATEKAGEYIQTAKEVGGFVRGGRSSLPACHLPAAHNRSSSPAADGGHGGAQEVRGWRKERPVEAACVEATCVFPLFC